MIIGIAGTIGAGKGTVVAYLKERKGFRHYSCSGMLKEILNERGVPATRANLSALADELNERYEGGVLHLAHDRAREDGAENYILEAIHRESEAAYVRSLGGIILGIDADVRTRYDRATARKEGEKDEVTFEQFLQDAQREDEGKGSGAPNIRAVLAGADAVIANDGTLDELHEQIDRFLASYEAA